MIRKILIALVVLILAFVVVVAIQPTDLHITRTATVAAPPTAVFPHVNDLRKWQAWSPWARIDPACKITFEGPQAGTGAVFIWNGNDEVGEGRMTIVESVPDELVRYRLDFVRPFAGTSDAEIALKPEGASGTLVTWTTRMKRNFLFKAFGLFVDCDKMMGDQLDKGLAQLKSVAETGTVP